MELQYKKQPERKGKVSIAKIIIPGLSAVKSVRQFSRGFFPLRETFALAFIE